MKPEFCEKTIKILVFKVKKRAATICSSFLWGADKSFVIRGSI
jgi:hypothetical protein